MPSINDVLIRLKVEGGEIVAQELDKTGDAAGRMGDNVDSANQKSKKSSALMGGLARAGKMGAVALGAMGAQSVWAGLKFNETFESAQTSFGVLLGDMDKGAAFTDRLRTITQDSPLRLTDYMESGKQLLSFGMSADQTMGTLRALDKVIVGTGKDGGDMQRVAYILGQMKSRGTATTQELNRLSLAGLDVKKYLRKELGLTNEQMASLGAEGIKSDKVIGAITKGWTKDFKNANEEMKDTYGFQKNQAIKSFEQFQREALEPVFKFMAETGFPALQQLLKGMMGLPKWAKSSAVALAALAGVVVLLGGPVTLSIAAIAAVGVLWAKFHDEIIGVYVAIGSAVGSVASAVGRWVSTAARNVAGFVSSLLPVRGAVAGITAYVRAMAPAWRVAWAVIKQVVGVGVDILKVQFGIVKAHIKILWGIIRRLGAIVGNVVGIVSNLLRGKWGNAWKNAQALVSNAMGMIKDAALGMLRLVVSIPGRILGVFGGLPAKIASAASGMFDGVKDALKDALNWVIDKFNWFLEKLRSFKVNLPKVGPLGGGSVGIPGIPGNIPGLASGGTIQRAGAVLIGEQGPELLSLPRAAQVTPLSSSGAAGSVRVEVPVYLDGREIARAFSGRIQDAAARA